MNVRRWVAAACLVAAACQGDVGTIRISLVTAPDSAVMDDVVGARLTLTSPHTVVEATRDPGGTLSLEMEVVADGPSGYVTFEGFDADQTLVAFGRSGPLPIAAIDADVAIYVAAPMSLAESPASLEPARSELALTGLTYGALLAGGRNGDGDPTSDLLIYNIYQHAFQVGDDLPSPRASMTAVAGDYSYVYLFGGYDADGNESATLWSFDTSIAPAGSYAVLASDSALARAGAAAAPLGQEAFLVAGDPPALIDGVAGRISPIAGTEPMDGTATTVSLAQVRYTLLAGRDVGATGATLYVSGSFTDLDAPAEVLRTGHGAVVLTDNNILVVGGATEDGPTAAALRFSPTTRAFVVLDDFLATPRVDAAIAATTQYVLVAGGRDADGNVIDDAEVFDADTLAPVGTMPMVVPRHSAAATSLSNGSILIAGGLDSQGSPVAEMELFTPTP